MPKLSIVVPVYKIEEYLQPCVESLQKQTFRDIEIILVDDGSPDQCGKLCDNLAMRDDRIRVIHQKNAGLSQARNAGIQAASGAYICFVDGDDLVSPYYCERLFLLLDGTTYDYSACGVFRFQDGTSPAPAFKTAETTVLSNVTYLEEQLEKKREFGIWNRLYRRELFEHIQFYPGRIHEDVIFSADIAKLRGGVVATSEELYFYRQRTTGIVAAGSRKCNPDRIFAGEYLVSSASQFYPELKDRCLLYEIKYPWSFVDKVYVHRSFADNRLFLEDMQIVLRSHWTDYARLLADNPIVLHRLRIFARSLLLYGINAYGRLARVFVFRFFGIDAYSDGHGI